MSWNGAGRWLGGSGGERREKNVLGKWESMCNNPDRREQVCLWKGELAQPKHWDKVQRMAVGPDHMEPYRPLRIRDYSESNGKSEAGSVV